MLSNPQVNSFSYLVGNALTTRPATAVGTSVTPANDTYGSYAQLIAGASVLYDCYDMILNANSISESGGNKDAILTIGVDPAGGTSYTTLIPDLLTSCAGPYDFGIGGIWFRFPLFVKAGSSIAAKWQQNSAAIKAGNVILEMRGQPSHPESMIYGQSVESIGIDATNSKGVTVTVGTTSEGAWTSLGTTAKRCIAWQLGMGIDDSSMIEQILHVDLAVGDGTTFTQILRALVHTGGTEQSTLLQPSAYYDVPAGATIYGRARSQSTPDTTISIAAHGVRA